MLGWAATAMAVIQDTVAPAVALVVAGVGTCMEAACDVSAWALVVVYVPAAAFADEGIVVTTGELAVVVGDQGGSELSLG